MWPEHKVEGVGEAGGQLGQPWETMTAGKTQKMAEGRGGSCDLTVPQDSSANTERPDHRD